MKVKDIVAMLEAEVPLAWQESYDNAGLAVGSPEAEVEKVLLALDITEEVVDDAIAGGFDVILSHHPLIFKGLRALEPSGAVARKSIKLIRHGISAMSFHTRLDALSGGVNDVLAARLGLVNVT